MYLNLCFYSLICILVEVTSFEVGLKICPIVAGIKKYKSTIKKKKAWWNSIVRAIIDWNIRYDKFISINDVLKKYDQTKEGMKKSD